MIGARSGLGFAFLPPGPVRPEPTDDLAELSVTARIVGELVQVVDLIPPPVNDLPPGPIAVRVRLLPPGPIAPARIELHILDGAAVSIFGPTGEPLAFCVSSGGQ